MAPPRDYRFQIEKSKSSRRSRRTQNYKMENSRYRKAHHTPSENYDKWYANEKFKSYNGSCLPRPVPSRSFEVQSQRDSFGCRSSEFDSNDKRRYHHNNPGSSEVQRDSFGSRVSDFDSNNNRRGEQSWPLYPTTSEISQPNQSYYKNCGPNDPSTSKSNPDGRYNGLSDSGLNQGGHRFGREDPRLSNNDYAVERSTSFEISKTRKCLSFNICIDQTLPLKIHVCVALCALCIRKFLGVRF